MLSISGRVMVACVAIGGAWMSGCFLNSGAFDTGPSGQEATGGAGGSTPSTTTSGGGATSSNGGAAGAAGSAGSTVSAGGTSTGGASTGGTTTGGAGGTTTSTPVPVCGNNVVESGEDCDDGNPVDGDGCNACHKDCGNPGCVAGTVCNDYPVTGLFTLKDPSSGHCYTLEPAAKSWNEARQECTLLGTGGDLVAPSTAAEMTFVLKLPIFMGANSGDGRFWTGGNDQAQEGVYKWSNSEQWNTPQMGGPSWKGGEPNGGSSDNCFPVGPDGTLRDRNCTADNFWFICEYLP